MAKRVYRKRARAEGESRTRARIVDAALDLWTGPGPAATTITAVAERAGVQRLTVYRHFPDDAALCAACWDRLNERHPVPDPADWATVADPARRLRRALRRLYAHYREAGDLLFNVLRDGDRLPALAGPLAARAAWLDGVIATLEPGWIARGKNRPLLDAALEHAVDPGTWRSLSSGGLDERQAARLIEQMVRSLAKKERVK